MALLTVPQVHTLQDALGDLLFDVVEGQVTVNFFAFNVVYIPVCLHGCAGTLVLNYLCFFLLLCRIMFICSLRASSTKLSG